MRFLWSKKQTKSQAKPVNIHELSKEIIGKKMKADPAFGEEIALRELKYERNEPEYYPESGGEHKPFKEYMSDVREMKSFIDEFKAETGGNTDSIWKTLIQSVGQGLGQGLAPIVGQLAPTLIQMFQKGQQPVSEPTARVEIPPREVQQPERIEQTEQPRLKKSPALSLDMLVELIKQEPSQAVENLRQYEPEVVSSLVKMDYDQIIKQVKPFSNDPRGAEILEKLSTDEGKMWVESVLSALKEQNLGEV